MAEDFEERFIKPIVHASYPGTLAALNLTALQVLQVAEEPVPWEVRFLLSFGSIVFLLSAFSIFFYTIYPTKKKLWTVTAISFLLGLISSFMAVIAVSLF
ncbi:MAG: hypothetical protein JSW53_00520 [Candidatus Bathyarchaeota archaeon]|nr:MAG: hypothetical protein JSW53_00520 [Candidatus Bathyarchaeota archaeon]